MIDTLHCIFLGVVPRFLEAAIWLCIVSNVWQVDATHTATRDQLCIQRCRADLFERYRRRARTHGARVTELSDLTLGMLGTRGSWSFSPKGAEARWMLPFVNELLVKHRASLPATATAMIECGLCLERLIVTMYDSPAKPSQEQCKAIELGTRGAYIKRKSPCAAMATRGQFSFMRRLCTLLTARKQIQVSLSSQKLPVCSGDGAHGIFTRFIQLCCALCCLVWFVSPSAGDV